MADYTDQYGLLTNTVNSQIPEPKDWDDLANGLEKSLRAFAETFGAGMLSATHFNITPVAGSPTVEIGNSDPDTSSSVAFIGSKDERKIVWKQGADTVTALNGIVLGTVGVPVRNYFFLQKKTGQNSQLDGTWIVNQSGTFPPDSELAATADFSNTEAVAYNNNPAGRKNILPLESDGKILVASDDVRRDYLVAKLVTDTAGGSGLSIVEENDGAGGKRLRITTTLDGKKVAVSGTDSTAGFLDDKLAVLAGDFLRKMVVGADGTPQTERLSTSFYKGSVPLDPFVLPVGHDGVIEITLTPFGTFDNGDFSAMIVDDQGVPLTLFLQAKNQVNAAHIGTKVTFLVINNTSAPAGTYGTAGQLNCTLHLQGFNFTPNGAPAASLTPVLTTLSGLGVADDTIMLKGLAVPTPVAGDTGKMFTYDGAAWALWYRCGSRCLLVAPARGDYATLSGALAAIGTIGPAPSAADPWCILVTGAIAEVATIVGKSHVHVLFLPGALLTSTIGGGGGTPAVSLSGLTNTTWSSVQGTRTSILAAGAAGAGIQLTNCDATVRLVGIDVDVNSTQGSYCVQVSGGSPELRDVYGTNSSNIANSYGCFLQSGAAPTMTHCNFTGGVNSNCHGLRVSASSPTARRCRFSGSATGTSSHGVSFDTPTISGSFYQCVAKGADGGAACHGWNLAGAILAVLDDCEGYGGDGGATCHGLFAQTGAQIFYRGGSYYGGTGGTSCYGARNTTNARFHPVKTSFLGGGVGRPAFASYTYTAATSPFQPSAAKPYRVTSITVVISVAQAGISVVFADAAIAGNALTGAVSLAAATTLQVDLTGQILIAGGAFIYPQFTGGTPADGSWSIQYTVEWSYGGATTTSCLGCYVDSSAANLFEDCIYKSNADSIALYFSTAGDDRTEVHGGVAASGKRSVGTRPKAVAAAAAWNPAPIDRLLMEGGQTNITCRAGTANGSSLEV